MKQSRARRSLAAVLTGVLATGAAVAFVPGADATGGSPRAYGLTANGTLVSFAVDRPGRAVTVGKINGLGVQALVGIDVRPANGKLYGVGRGGGLFTINPKNAQARRVSTLDVGLSGQSFGVDVNPAADALRIVSNTGQNLRHAFAGHVTTADATLNVPDTTPRVRGIVGAAYTNNDKDDTTGTALFDLDAAADSVALQVPANAGTITSQGPLGRKTSARAGFDIHSARSGGKAVRNTGYATLGGNRGYALYTVDLLSGRASQVGEFDQLVVDLAVVH
ncbi:DUF4394 domain-containing protein [Nocardioides sp.]|uniref:DUF4394 domain-containing protein n=1 Tax=Nocardioides sp. TaxID=35761 RepID=UPI00271DC06C|nr:DUF4394 domain-containing protein [Nocardioides sp.]MDO9457644.1 DUF4394 domain-containing protein [Nocardioides sp.]